MLKKKFTDSVAALGNTKASVQTADEAIRVAENAISTHQLGIMQYLENSFREEEDYAKLCSSTFDRLVRRIAELDPEEGSEYDYVVRNLPLCKKYLEANLIQAITLYSAMLVEGITVEVLQGGGGEEPGSIEVLDMLVEGETRKILTVDRTCFTFAGLVAYLSTSRSCENIEKDQIYKGILESLLNRTNAFKGVSADLFIKATSLLAPKPYAQQGIKGELPEVSSFLAIDVVRRFSEELTSDKSRCAYTLSSAAYNAYKMLLDDYLLAILENAKRLVAMTKFSFIVL